MYLNRSIQKKKKKKKKPGCKSIQTQPSKSETVFLFRHPQKGLQTKETSENQSLPLLPQHSEMLV